MFADFCAAHKHKQISHMFRCVNKAEHKQETSCLMPDCNYLYILSINNYADEVIHLVGFHSSPC